MSCFVKSCKNYRRKCKIQGQGILFHQFPVDEERRNQWRSVSNQAPGKWTPRSTICSAHFKIDDYLDLETGTLLSTATPSQNLDRAGENIPSIRKVEEFRQEITKWKNMYYKLKQDSRDKRAQLNTKMFKLNLIGRRWKTSKVETMNKWKSKYLKAKNQIKHLRQVICTTKLQNISSIREEKKNQVKVLKPLFTDTQIDVVLSNKTKTWWNEENISKAMCLRAKSPSAYDFVRKEWKIPLPSLSTLGRWVKNIVIKPGLILPVLNLLKFEFQDKEEFDRQCCLSFDEMSLDGTVCYDPAEDKILGPHSNLMVVFVRGLFGKWKQPIYFGYDDKLDNNKLIEIIQEVQKCNLVVRSCTNDNATTNTGKWKKLGVSHKKTSFEIPGFGNNVYCFSDAPHLIKLLRNNLLDHGFTLKDGTTIGKADLEEIIKADINNYANMILSEEERERTPLSWSQNLSQGYLAIPSYDWLSLFRQMNQYFMVFHCYRNGSKWPLNDCSGVIEILSRRIHDDFPTVDFQLIKHFVRLRTFIRIKHINNKIIHTKLMLKKWRKNQQFARSHAPSLRNETADKRF